MEASNIFSESSYTKKRQNTKKVRRQEETKECEYVLGLRIKECTAKSFDCR